MITKNDVSTVVAWAIIILMGSLLVLFVAFILGLAWRISTFVGGV